MNGDHARTPKCMYWRGRDLDRFPEAIKSWKIDYVFLKESPCFDSKKKCISFAHSFCPPYALHGSGHP